MGCGCRVHGLEFQVCVWGLGLCPQRACRLCVCAWNVWFEGVLQDGVRGWYDTPRAMCVCMECVDAFGCMRVYTQTCVCVCVRVRACVCVYVYMYTGIN